MRWTALALMVVTACSFEGGRGALDARPSTGDGRSDAPGDGAPGATCVLGAGATTTDRGKVGLSEGGSAGSIACDGDARIVGLALDMSDGLADGVTRSARGIRIACATVTIDGAGGHTDGIVFKDLEGNGGSGWTPSTWTEVAECPPGALVSGLAVHGSPFTSYFLDATMSCARFDTTAAVAEVTTVGIAGSGSDVTHASGAQCDPGEQVAELATSTGAGLDSVRLLCASTICE